MHGALEVLSAERDAARDEAQRLRVQLHALERRADAVIQQLGSDVQAHKNFLAAIIHAAGDTLVVEDADFQNVTQHIYLLEQSVDAEAKRVTFTLTKAPPASGPAIVLPPATAPAEPGLVLTH